MPRLGPALLRAAAAISPNLGRLLLACRDLESACAELGWISQHVASTTTTSSAPPGVGARPRKVRIARLCARRGRGTPLQYVLGSQPFGDLDVLCRPGVLIPRPETEAYAAHLASVLRDDVSKKTRKQTGLGAGAGPGAGPNERLVVLDLCTGTGCIALSLCAALGRHFPRLEAHGIDISAAAVRLARRNALHNAAVLGTSRPAGPPRLRFTRADVLAPDILSVISSLLQDEEEEEEEEKRGVGRGGIVVLVSNPPYIDPAAWATGGGGGGRGQAPQLAPSVRRFEPELALVAREDAAEARLVPPAQASDRPVSPLILPEDAAGRTAEPTTTCSRQDAFYRRLAEITRAVRPEFSLWEVGDGAQAGRVLALVEGMGLLREWECEVWRDWPDLPASTSAPPEGGDDTAVFEWAASGADPVVVRCRGEGNIRSIFLRRRDRHLSA